MNLVPGTPQLLFFGAPGALSTQVITWNSGEHGVWMEHPSPPLSSYPGLGDHALAALGALLCNQVKKNKYSYIGVARMLPE